MSFDEKEILKVINETLGLEEAKESKKSLKAKATLNESYVVQAKKYDINTDLLSSKALKANLEDFENTVQTVNEVSAKLDSVDRSNANSKDSAFRELKACETYNVNGAFLSAYHFDNIADPVSKISMDSLAYMRLTRDFGTFEDWQRDFIACSMSGRDGWVVTVYNGFLDRYMNIFIDDNSTGVPMNCYPVIVLCTKERMYFRDYLNDRRKYVFAMMKELNWTLIDRRIKRADKLSKIFSAGLPGEPGEGANS